MLSVVIPALDEEEAIAETIDTIRENLEAAKIPHEIIVVSDGSTDKTSELAKEHNATVIEHPAPGGYGKSLKDGIRSCQYDLVAITDADGTYPNEQLVKLYKLVHEDGFDMAVGARTGKHYRGTFLKMPARRVFLWLCNYATGQQIEDINSGLRVFRKDIATRYEHTICDGFSFTTTITLAAMQNGYFVKYIPIEYFKRKGSSHVRYYRDTLRALQIIVENILYYNPLKLYLLVVNTLFLLSLIFGVIALVIEQSNANVLLSALSAASFAAAFVVAAVGLSAVLSRSHQRRDE